MALEVINFKTAQAAATQETDSGEDAVVWTYRQIVLGDTDMEAPPGGVVPDVQQNENFISCGDYAVRKRDLAP